MNRKRFLADALMAIAVSLVPKILQPVVPELVEMPLQITFHIVDFGDDGVVDFSKGIKVIDETMTVPKETADWLWERVNSYVK